MKWTDRIRNDEVFRRIEKKRNLMRTMNRRKTSWMRHVVRRNCLLQKTIEEIVEGKGSRDRTRFAMLTGVLERRSYLVKYSTSS